ncbi:MAG: hypothetical protein RL609_1140, partial [Bacteroidota bacterium]
PQWKTQMEKIATVFLGYKEQQARLHSFLIDGDIVHPQ